MATACRRLQANASHNNTPPQRLHTNTRFYFVSGGNLWRMREIWAYTLVSNNIKEFERVNDFLLENWV